MRSLRLLAVATSLAFTLACDDYAEVQAADDIPTYEAWLKDNADNTKAFQATIRLEELYLQKARESKDLAEYDAYLERWPEGHHREKAMAEREALMFAWAAKESTVEAWQRYVDAYPKGEKKYRVPAKRALEATTYAQQMSFSEVEIRKVNLAEDPDGPLDGTAFKVVATNNGDKTLDSMWLRIHYLDANGNSVEHRDWPLVAPYVEFPVPVEEELTKPMKPGDTRTWDWWAGELPEGYADKARVVPLKLRFAKEP